MVPTAAMPGMRQKQLEQRKCLSKNRCNSLSCTVRTSRQRSCNQRVGFLKDLWPYNLTMHTLSKVQYSLLRSCGVFLPQGYSMQEGRGHWAVNHTRPQTFIAKIRWLNNFWDFFEFCFKSFQPLIVIYRRGNFVYHHWVCTSIYRSLSFPFRSVFLMLFVKFFFITFVLLALLEIWNDKFI